MTSKVYVPCLLFILFLQTTLSTVLQKQTVVSFRSQAELNVANKKSRVVGRLLTKLTSAATENRQTLALDGTTTPFGKIQTATLHLIFVVVGGVMFLSIIVMATFLVKRNMTPSPRIDLPENEPLMNEEHGVSSSEHHRQAFLQASQILSETASTLEKEREKTFAAATAAKEFEQQNRALLRATGKERKQKELLLQEKERERLVLVKEKEQLQLQANAEQVRLRKEHDVQMQAAESDRIRLTEQYEQALAQQQDAANALAMEIKKNNPVPVPDRLYIADETARMKAEHAAQLVQQEKSAAMELAQRKRQISQLEASYEAGKKMLLDAKHEKEQLMVEKEQEKAHLLKEAKESMAQYVKDTDVEKSRLQTSHDLLIKKEQQASDSEKIEMLNKAKEEQNKLTEALHSLKVAAEKEKTTLFKSFEEGLKSEKDKLLKQMEDEKKRMENEKKQLEDEKKQMEASIAALKVGKNAAESAACEAADHCTQLKSELAATVAAKAKILREKESRQQEAEEHRQKIESEAILDSEKEAKRNKKRRPSFRGALLTETKVVDIIGAILEKKARNDKIRSSKLLARVSLAESSRSFFVQMFGSIARDRRMAQFRHSVTKHKGNTRVQWFSTLIGWNDDYTFGMYTPFRGDAIHVFIDFLTAIFPIDSIEDLLDQDPCLVRLARVYLALGVNQKLAHTDDVGSSEEDVVVDAVAVFLPSSSSSSSVGTGDEPAARRLFDAEYRTTASFQTLLSVLQDQSFAKETSGSGVGGTTASTTTSSTENPDRYIEYSFVIHSVLSEYYRWKVPQDTEKESFGASSGSLMVL